MSQTLPSDSPAVTALCVAHRWEMRLQSRSRSARALARPVGMAGRPFPPKPPGISCPSGCCSPAFSPRGPEGAGAGGLEGTRGGGVLGRAGHQAQIQLDRESGRGSVVTRPPKAAPRAPGALAPPRHTGFLLSAWGCAHQPAPREPPGCVPALPCTQVSPLHRCGSEQLCDHLPGLSLSAAEASKCSSEPSEAVESVKAPVQVPGT